MNRPYTGPTGFTFRPDSFHIEGYPNADRVVKLTTPVGKRLADMRLHDSDLGFCERTMQIYGSTLRVEAGDLSRALWITVLTKFYSCFGTSASRASLDAKKVYAGKSDAMRAFWYYQNMRNKNIVHDENNYAYGITGIVLGPASEVQDILSLQFQTMTDNFEDGQNMYNLIDAAQKYVSDQIGALLSKAFIQTNMLSPQQRVALPPLQVTAPGPGDEGISRKY